MGVPITNVGVPSTTNVGVPINDERGRLDNNTGKTIINMGVPLIIMTSKLYLASKRVRATTQGRPDDRRTRRGSPTWLPTIIFGVLRGYPRYYLTSYVATHDIIWRSDNERGRLDNNTGVPIINLGVPLIIMTSKLYLASKRVRATTQGRPNSVATYIDKGIKNEIRQQQTPSPQHPPDRI